MKKITTFILMALVIGCNDKIPKHAETAQSDSSKQSNINESSFVSDTTYYKYGNKRLVVYTIPESKAKQLINAYWESQSEKNPGIIGTNNIYNFDEQEREKSLLLHPSVMPFAKRQDSVLFIQFPGFSLFRFANKGKADGSDTEIQRHFLIDFDSTTKQAMTITKLYESFITTLLDGELGKELGNGYVWLNPKRNIYVTAKEMQGVYPMSWIGFEVQQRFDREWKTVFETKELSLLGTTGWLNDTCFVTSTHSYYKDASPSKHIIAILEPLK